MRWVLAFHVIAMVCWFAGIFYLPRLFVYHVTATDEISQTRFKIMERRLYRGIMTPSGIVTSLLGMWLIALNYKAYASMGWLHAKLFLVALLWIFHLCCGHWRQQFNKDQNEHSEMFFRVMNELPVFLLVGIVILVIVKPF